VWDEFTGDQNRLHATATAIRQVSVNPIASMASDDFDDDEAPEGRILFRLHKSRERSPGLVRERKRRALQQHGKLLCEVCNFDFRAMYRGLGEGFIECHHTVPKSELETDQKTKVNDLALVCANCHRMLHRGGKVVTIVSLR